MADEPLFPSRCGYRDGRKQCVEQEDHDGPHQVMLADPDPGVEPLFSTRPEVLDLERTLACLRLEVPAPVHDDVMERWRKLKAVMTDA